VIHFVSSILAQNGIWPPPSNAIVLQKYVTNILLTCFNNRDLDVPGNYPRSLVLKQGTTAGEGVHQPPHHGVGREKRVRERGTK
jgi:hypothetical protein